MTVSSRSDLINTGRLLEVGEYCRKELGSSLFCEVMSEQMRRNGAFIPEPHKILMSLPFSSMVTTNYDKLLEQAYCSLMEGVIPRTATHKDTASLGTLLFDGRFFILKAHGDIDQPDSLILTASDYRELIHSNPAYNTMLSALLLTKAILFVGYSMSDPDFRLLLDHQFTAFKGTVPARYALMSGVSDVEQSVLWDTAQIQVLSYSDHKEILPFFQKIQEHLLDDT